MMMTHARSMRVKLALRCTVMVEVPLPNLCAPIIGRRSRVGTVLWRSLRSGANGRVGGLHGGVRDGGITRVLHVADDWCVAVLLSHGREGAEDEAVDIGDYGGAPRGDAAFGE